MRDSKRANLCQNTGTFETKYKEITSPTHTQYTDKVNLREPLKVRTTGNKPVQIVRYTPIGKQT